MAISIEKAVPSDAALILEYLKQVGGETDNSTYDTEGLPFSVESEAYLYDHYKDHGIDTSLFMKLVEEVGEVAEVLNKRDGRKASDSEDLKSQLANELVDVIHYAFAIASLNEIDLNDVILEKDKKASIKYNHERNLEQFMLER